MEIRKEGYGVIVGRFQVPEFHEGHKWLLDTVRSQHLRTIVFLGCSTGNPDVDNGLDFGIRQQYLTSLYPDITCIPIYDCQDDLAWSKELDRNIANLVTHNAVILYGGRDSFIKHYFGKYPTHTLPEALNLSGTAIRDSITIKNSIDFREGVIWALRNQFPRVNPTVDIAVIKGSSVLLGKKPGQNKYVFPGGYFDRIQDRSNEQAAIRELFEETGLKLTEEGQSYLKYLGSRVIDDPRDRGKKQTTLTSFFLSVWSDGEPIGADDLEKCEYISLKDAHNVIADWHKPLLDMLLNYVGEDLKG